MPTNSLAVWNLTRLAQESGQPVHPVAVVGLLEMDRLWYITVDKTHPRVFPSEDVFLAGDSWPPEAFTKGGW